MLLTILIIAIFNCFTYIYCAIDYRQSYMCRSGDCVSKCCSEGMVYRKIPRNSKCAPKLGVKDLILDNKVPIYSKTDIKDHVFLKENYTILTGISCRKYFVKKTPSFLQKDGSLYIRDLGVYDVDNYCIDTFVVYSPQGNVSYSDALICFPRNRPNERHTFTCICMLTSCVFILITLGVYAWLPELRNIHGKVLMAYLLCLFVAFLMLTTMKLVLIVKEQITEEFCLTLTLFTYFFLLAAFFWLNVMSYDIWCTFRNGGRPSRPKTKRFYAYCTYAFGGPVILTSIVVGLEFSDIRHPLMPNLKGVSCFITGDSKLLYLYGPIVVLWSANMVFFILTAIKIAETTNQITMLRCEDSNTHDPTRSDKQRYAIYIKLFIVMGVNWILEIAAVWFPEYDNIWQYIDVYNALIGLIVFFIFVCKRKVYWLVKKKYMSVRESSRTVTSHDDMEMKNSVKRRVCSSNGRANGSVTNC